MHEQLRKCDLKQKNYIIPQITFVGESFYLSTSCRRNDLLMKHFRSGQVLSYNNYMLIIITCRIIAFAQPV